jgi:hypothetical protein
MTISHLAAPTLKAKMALEAAEKNLLDYAPSGTRYCRLRAKNWPEPL